MTSLSHPAFTKNVDRLSAGWETFSWPVRPQREATGRRRFATVGDAVVEVLDADGGSLRFVEIHAHVERLLGEAVAKSSVKNYLANRSKGARPLFDRVGHGQYRLRCV